MVFVFEVFESDVEVIDDEDAVFDESEEAEADDEFISEEVASSFGLADAKPVCEGDDAASIAGGKCCLSDDADDLNPEEVKEVAAEKEPSEDEGPTASDVDDVDEFE